MTKTSLLGSFRWLMALCLLFVSISPSLAPAQEAKQLRKFLMSTEGTYGWQPVEGSIGLDFFPDGRLSAQGPDGEATMWEGKWSLKGDQLTYSFVDNDGRKQGGTFTIAIDGEMLVIGDRRYKRYRP